MRLGKNYIQKLALMGAVVLGVQTTAVAFAQENIVLSDVQSRWKESRAVSMWNRQGEPASASSSSSDSASSSSSDSVSSSSSDSASSSGAPSAPLKPKGIYQTDGTLLEQGETVRRDEHFLWVDKVVLQEEPTELQPPTGLKMTEGVLIHPQTNERTVVAVQENGAFLLPSADQVGASSTVTYTAVPFHFEADSIVDESKINPQTGEIQIGSLVAAVENWQPPVPALPDYEIKLYDQRYDAMRPNDYLLQTGATVSLRDKFYFVVNKPALQHEVPQEGDVQEGQLYQIMLPKPLVSAEDLVNMPISIQGGQLQIATINTQRGSDHINIVFQMQENSDGYTLEDVVDLNIAFGCAIDQRVAVPDDQGRIEIVLGEAESIIVTVEEMKPRPPEPPKLTKTSGAMTNTGVTAWTVSYTAPQGAYQGNIPAKLIDRLPEGLEWVEPDQPDPRLHYDAQLRTITYDTTNLPPDTVYPIRFTYQTKVSPQVRNELWQNGAHRTFRNVISAVDELDEPVRVEDTPLTASAQTTTQPIRPLMQKRGQNLDYDEESARYLAHWSIAVDPIDAVFDSFQIVDTYGAGLRFEEQPVVRLHNEQGEIVCAPEYVVLEPESNTLTVDLTAYLPQIQGKPFRVQFSTEVDARYVDNIQPSVPSTLEPLRNRAVVRFGAKNTPQDEEPTQYQTPVSEAQPSNVNMPLMVKASAGVNHAERALEWTVTINPRRTAPLQSPQLNRVQFEDRYLKNQGNYNWLSFGLTAEEEQAQIASITQQIQQQNPQIDVNVMIRQNAEEKLLQVNLENAGSDPVVFRFKTYIQSVTGWGGNINNIRYENTARLNAQNTTVVDRQGQELPLQADVVSSASTTIPRAYTLRKEDASYDPAAQIMTWRIRLNERGAPLRTVKITDTLPEGLEYIPWSSTVDGQQLQEGEGAEQNYVIQDGSRLIFHLKNVRTPREILFQTRVDTQRSVFQTDRLIHYRNQAKLEIFWQNEWVQTADAQHTASIKNAVLTKTALSKAGGPVYDTDGSKAVDYEVVLNPLQLNLLTEQQAQVFLEDYLDQGLLLNTESLRLYQAVSSVRDVNGTYTPVTEKGQELTPEYEYDPLSNYFKLKVPDPQQSYILTYTAYLTRSGVTLGNKISLVGSVMDQNTNGVGFDTHSVRFQAVGGAALRPPKNKYVSVLVKKTDAAGRAVPGAKIALYREKDETTQLSVGVSDQSGNCVLSIPKSQIAGVEKLYYKELEAPQGYLLNQEWHEISVQQAQAGDAGVLQNIRMAPNAVYSIEVQKQNMSGQPLPNAEFGLYRDAQAQELIRTAATNREGRALFDGLSEGVYYVKEIKAPAGYALSEEVHISQVNAQQQKAVVRTQNRPLPVRLNVTKRDAETADLLTGAVFELYAQEGAFTASQITQNGVCSFEGLMPGETYYLRELQPPEGYFINPNIYTIHPQIGADSEIDVANTKHPVTLKVVKRDNETRRALSGASFVLTADAQGESPLGEPVKTNEAGEAYFENLIQNTTYYLWEQKAPDGYQRKEAAMELRTQTQAVMEYEVLNEEIPVSLTVYKRDAETGRPLEGAELQLTKDPQGQIAAAENQITNHEGTAIFEGLKPGVYYLKEVRAPEGYVLSQEVVPCEVLSVLHQTPAVATVENAPAPVSLEILKVDAETQQPLHGAEFQLYVIDKSKRPVGDVQVTQENGICRFDGLVPGRVYYVRETKAPDTYLENPTEYKVVPKIAEQSSLTVRNTKHPVSLSVTKRDYFTEQPLKGAAFQLTLDDEGDHPVSDVKRTDDRGNVVFDFLVQNTTYYLWELEAPEGYQRQSDPIVIQTDTREQLEYTVKNQQLPVSITVKKRDAVTQAPLAKAKFRLTSDEQGQIPAGPDVVTNRQGQGLFENLRPGTYYLWELEAPKGYVQAQQPYVCAVEPQKPITVTVSNEPAEVSAMIYKHDAQSNEPLKGAVFQAFDENGKKLGKPVTTNDEGIAQISGLKPGKQYYIQEIKPPHNYSENNAQYWFTPRPGKHSEIAVPGTKSPVELTVQVQDEFTKMPLKGAVVQLTADLAGNIVIGASTATGSDGRVRFSGLIQGKSYYLWEREMPAGYRPSKLAAKISIGHELQQQHLIEKAQLPGVIEIEKIGSITKKPLAGAKFRISNEPQAELPVVQDLVTDAQGRAATEALRAGTYYLKELEPPTGYRPLSRIHQVTVAPGETTVLQLENDPEPVTLQLKKIDGQTAKLLKGAEFQLYEDETCKQPVGTAQTTAENGEAAFEGLIPGRVYYLKELRAAHGYFLNPAVYKIIPAAGKDSFLTVQNSKYPVQVVVYNRDADTNEPLTGTKYQLTLDAQGNTVVGTVQTSDENGRVVFEGLQQNRRYYLWELEPPEGYQANSGPISVVTTSEAVLEQDVFNRKLPVGLRIEKIDAENERPLQGAVFRLTFDEQGQLPAAPDKVTGEDGLCEIRGVIPGRYYLWELHAPHGYAPVQQSYICELAPLQDTSVTIENRAQPVMLRVLKTDDRTGAALPGAVFGVMEGPETDKLVGLPQTTDENGVAVFEGLQPNRLYYLKELTPPQGYFYHDTVYEVEMPLGDSLQVQVKNTQKPAVLNILKRDAENGKPLADAVFRLTQDADGKVLIHENLKTGADGRVRVEGLMQNTTYYLWEQTAPNGYQKRQEPIPVLIKPDTETEYMVDNALQTVSITFYLTDEVTGAPLGGHFFQLTLDPEGKIPASDIVQSLADGSYTFHGLKPNAVYYLWHINPQTQRPYEGTAPIQVLTDSNEYKHYTVRLNAQNHAIHGQAQPTAAQIPKTGFITHRLLWICGAIGSSIMLLGLMVCYCRKFAKRRNQ